MITLAEAQELHELIGATLETLEDEELVRNLERARELAALIVSDLEAIS